LHSWEDRAREAPLGRAQLTVADYAGVEVVAHIDRKAGVEGVVGGSKAMKRYKAKVKIIGPEMVIRHRVIPMEFHLLFARMNFRAFGLKPIRRKRKAKSNA
jgi:hypothetical protein